MNMVIPLNISFFSRQQFHQSTLQCRLQVLNFIQFIKWFWRFCYVFGCYLCEVCKGCIKIKIANILCAHEGFLQKLLCVSLCQVYCHVFTGVLSLQISNDNPGGTRHGRCRFHLGYCCPDCYFPGVEGVCICVFALEASLHAMR